MPPEISGVSGSSVHGESLTITGTGFGTKSTAAPFKYDDFSGGTNGQVIANGWGTLVAGGTLEPIYSNTIVRTARSPLSVQSRFLGGQWNSSWGITEGLTPFIDRYVDVWYYYDAASPPSRNHKIIWCREFAGGGASTTFYTVFCDNNGALFGGSSPGEGTGTSNVWMSGPNQGTAHLSHKWSHLQLVLRQNDPAGIGNGWMRIYVDGLLVGQSTQFLSRGEGKGPWGFLWFGSYMAHGSAGSCAASGDGRTYWSNAYVDTTWARVELGNADTYGASTHREIQIPTSWSDTGIGVTINRGSFDDEVGPYLYVIDSDGDVNAVGFELSGDPPDPPDPPPPPPKPRKGRGRGRKR